MTRWRVHGEHALYSSHWIDLRLVDVELPDGDRFPHHVVRMHRDAVGVVAVDPERGVLLIHRHRFITDTWGWEIPAGAVDEGEALEEAAIRETLEETGWRPGPLQAIGAYHPQPGAVDQRFHVFVAQGAEHVGEPRDTYEAERVEWVPVARVRELISAGEVTDGYSLTGLLWALELGLLG
jgi:8-oxo-dGTP pyrophosphatase MutT (NUDIX family)